MKNTIRIQMMNQFLIYIDETRVDQLTAKTRKGARLIQYLILNGGKPVSNQRLLSALWSEESANPENALKTLISRLRVILNQMVPELGSCIIAERGAYSWQCMPGMTIDLYEIEGLLDRLMNEENDKETTCALYDQLMSLYTGDLLRSEEIDEWALSRATALHDKYMSAVYAYVDILKADERWEDVVSVCRMGLDVDNFDDHLHMDLMTALINTNRTADALNQYRHVVNINYRYLGIQTSPDMQEFYKTIVRAGKTLDFSIESVANELRQSDSQRGAFVCEYSVFKEIFNLQIRNLERLGSSMFLGMIMVGNPDQAMEPLKQDAIMTALLDITRMNLRKGDTITQLSPTMLALLLPAVNYTTGNMVMERIKRRFYAKYGNSSIAFHYRIGPLSADRPEENEPEKPHNGDAPEN